METRKKTTAGVLFWTPAPARTSPTSSVISEDAWEDEDEVQAEKDDFVSQMDENGIIGLSEALEGVEFGESCGDSDAECNPHLYTGPLSPEAHPSGHERHTPEEQSYNSSESPGMDGQILSLFEDFLGSLKSQTLDEKVRQSNVEQRTECVPECDKYLDMTEDEKDGKENTGKQRDRKKTKSIHTSTPGELGPTKGLIESFMSKGEIEKISSTPSCSAHLLATEPASFSNHHCPVSSIIASTLPHLLHFTAEELAAAPGIDAETLPEMSFTESHPVSHRSLKSSPCSPEVKPRTCLKPTAMFSEEVMLNHYSGVGKGPSKASDKSDKPHKPPTPSPRKLRQRSPEATYSRTHSSSTVRADSLKFKHRTASSDRETRTPRAGSNAAVTDESRKGPLSYRTPDFSKVEPRVHFPKDGYKPPKSKRYSMRKSLSPEPPLVYKSPADIVKEVLLNTTEGSPASPDSYTPPTIAPNSTVPQEFRNRQQATTLLDQLQEDHNRLLTKYAEAKNTIDRLRLKAKVDLFSDPPKPGHLVQSGPNQDASKIMMLNFPQNQRAEISSASLHPNGLSSPQRSPSACPPTRSPDPQMGQQLAKILYHQADKFLQQLQTFEDLLKSRKVLPFDQIKGLSQLAEGLESLERGYLLAKDQHKLLQQPGAGISHFDPERELEGLIFQCGLRMDELKERVEEQQQEEPTCEAPPSPSPHPIPSSAPSEGQATLTHQQSPPEPLLVDPGQAAVVEVSSASEETDEEEETLNSLYLTPPNGKHRRVVQDFSTPMDHYQSFKELPKRFDQREVALLSGALESHMQPGKEEKETQGHKTGNLEVQKNVPSRLAISDYPDSPPVHTRKQQASRSSPPSNRASSQSTTPHVPRPSSRRRLEMGKSHSSSLSSLGEITPLEKRSSKVQTGSRVFSQDGIVSPETDSGFVCSESSRLTPAAAPSPVHQRASESVSVPQEGKTGCPATSPASSPSHSQTATEPRRGSRLLQEQPRRSRQVQKRRTFSCSPQQCLTQTEPARADSGTSDFGLESDSSHTLSEDRQNNRYADSVNSLHNSSPSSSPAARYHHGNPLRALSTSQVANCNDAIQTLQTEVTRLRERLESCLKNKKLLSTVRAAPSAQENSSRHNTSTPRIRSGERWEEDIRGGRDRQTDDESTLRRTTRKRPPPAHRHKPQPDMLTEPSTPQPQPLVSRCTQTSTEAPDNRCSHTNTAQSRTHPRQPSVSEAADEPDSRGRQAPLCPQCLSRCRGRPEMPVGGDKEPTPSSHCLHCPVCGRPEPYRSSEPECRRVSAPFTHTSCQPAQEGAVRSVYFAAAPPPALMRCMPVCPTPLLLYPSPLHMSPGKSTGTSSEVRGREEVRGRTRRSLSVDRQRSVDTSLNRAIRAARHMKHTSGHMARSLASGLNYQELLAQSCSY